MQPIRFGFTEVFPFTYRAERKPNPLSVYEEKLKNQGVPYLVRYLADKSFVITPDDAAAALGRIQALKDTISACQVRGVEARSYIQQQTEALLNTSKKLDFWV